MTSPTGPSERRVQSLEPCIIAGVDLGTVRTPVQFRALLRCVQQASERNGGTIAALTKMAHSQAYNLASPKCTALPRYPVQVEQFVTACKLTPAEVAAVMALWQALKTSVSAARQEKERSRRDA